MGDANTHERLIRELAAKTGAAVIFPVYTPSPEAQYPQPVEELYGALEYVVKNAAELRVDLKIWLLPATVSAEIWPQL